MKKTDMILLKVLKATGAKNTICSSFLEYNQYYSAENKTLSKRPGFFIYPDDKGKLSVKAYGKRRTIQKVIKIPGIIPGEHYAVFRYQNGFFITKADKEERALFTRTKHTGNFYQGDSKMRLCKEAYDFLGSSIIRVMVHLGQQNYMELTPVFREPKNFYTLRDIYSLYGWAGCKQTPKDGYYYAEFDSQAFACPTVFAKAIGLKKYDEFGVRMVEEEHKIIITKMNPDHCDFCGKEIHEEHEKKVTLTVRKDWKDLMY